MPLLMVVKWIWLQCPLPTTDNCRPVKCSICISNDIGVIEDNDAEVDPLTMDTLHGLLASGLTDPAIFI